MVLALSSVCHGQSVVIPMASFGARPGNLRNDGISPAATFNTTVQVTVPTGYALSNTINLVAGDFWENPDLPQTSLADLGFKLTNDAWPGLVAFVTAGLNSTKTEVSVSTLVVRSFGNSGSAPWSNMTTLETGMVVPEGSTWMIECYDNDDNSSTEIDAFGQGIRFDMPGSSAGTAVSTISLVGPVNFGGERGSADNSLITGLSPLDQPKYLGSGVRLLGGQLSAQIAGSWASEARIHLVNSALPGLSFDFQLSHQNSSFNLISVPAGEFRPWISSAGTGVALPSGSTWQVETFEAYDDAPGADAIGTGITFEIMAGSPSFPVQAFTIPGVANLADPYPDPDNTAYSEVAQLNSCIASFATISASYERVAPDSWAADALIAITNSAHPGKVAYLQPFPGIQNVATLQAVGMRPLIGSLIGSTIPASSLYRFEMSDEVANLEPGAVEALMSNITVSLYSSAPMPQASLNGTLVLGGGTDVFGFPRSISYELRRGAAKLASGTVLATGAEAPFYIPLSPVNAGPAILTWTGPSYLRRDQQVNIITGQQDLGTFTLPGGDIDGSGEVDAADIDRVITDFGFVGNFLSDADGSGEVDAGDIDAVISSFGLTND